MNIINECKLNDDNNNESDNHRNNDNKSILM